MKNALSDEVRRLERVSVTLNPVIAFLIIVYSAPAIIRLNIESIEFGTDGIEYMHICLVDLRWRGHHTPYVEYLSQYFIEQDHQITYVTSRANPRVSELTCLPSLNVCRVDIDPEHEISGEGLVASIKQQALRTRELQRISKAIGFETVDIVHFLTYDGSQLPHALTGGLKRTPETTVVATLHRDMFLQQGSGGIGSHLTRTLTIFGLNFSLTRSILDYVTVHAPSIRHRIIGGVPGATRQTVRMLPAPTPQPQHVPSVETARERLKLETGVDMILLFGELRYEKGPDQAFAALEQCNSEITVVLAGKPIDFSESEITSWIKAMPDTVSVETRLEFIPEEHVNLYFTAADALLLPYRRQTGISGPLRRAAFVGTPVIGPQASDIGDIITQKQIGVTYDSNAELRTILANVTDSISNIDEQSLDEFATSRHWRTTGRVLEQIYTQDSSNSV